MTSKSSGNSQELSSCQNKRRRADEENGQNAVFTDPSRKGIRLRGVKRSKYPDYLEESMLRISSVLDTFIPEYRYPPGTETTSMNRKRKINEDNANSNPLIHAINSKPAIKRRRSVQIDFRQSEADIGSNVISTLNSSSALGQQQQPGPPYPEANTLQHFQVAYKSQSQGQTGISQRIVRFQYRSENKSGTPVSSDYEHIVQQIGIKIDPESTAEVWRMLNNENVQNTQTHFDDSSDVLAIETATTTPDLSSDSTTIPSAPPAKTDTRGLPKLEDQRSMVQKGQGRELHSSVPFKQVAEWGANRYNRAEAVILKVRYRLPPMKKWSPVKAPEPPTESSFSQPVSAKLTTVVKLNIGHTRSGPEENLDIAIPDDTRLTDDIDRFEYGLIGLRGPLSPRYIDQFPELKANAAKRNRERFLLHPQSSEYDNWRAEHPFKSWFGNQQPY